MLSNILTIGDDIIVLLMALTMFGMVMTSFIIRHLYMRFIANLVDYYDKKFERAKKFADEEQDQDKKTTYRALQYAWEQAREQAEKGLK